MSKNFVLSLIFSAFVHGVLLFGAKAILTEDKKVFSRNDGIAAINVRLSVYQEPEEVSPPVPKALAGKKKLKNKKLSKKSQASNSKVVKTAGQDEALALYLSKVRNAILQNKVKLRMAKRLRLKGDVGLYFRLIKPNKIQGVRILKPSGYKQLDESALATMEAVEEIPVMPDNLELSEIPITVVISYQ